MKKSICFDLNNLRLKRKKPENSSFRVSFVCQT